MKGFRRLLSFRNVFIAGLASSVSGGVLVAHCSTSFNEEFPDFNGWDRNWDKRDPLSLVRRFKRRRAVDGSYYNEKIELKEEDVFKKTAKSVRNIILIRHGQYHIDGENDAGHTLTTLGEEQAELTGKRLAELGIKFDSIVCSDMIRAKQTANLVLKNLDQKDLKITHQDPLLNEGPPSLPEPHVMTHEWRPDLHEFFTHSARIEAAFRKYIHRAYPEQEKESYEIIVCHGNVIRYFFCRSLQFQGDAWLRMNVHHASLTVLSILPSGRVILKSLSDAGHMPPEKVTVS